MVVIEVKIINVGNNDSGYDEGRKVVIRRRAGRSRLSRMRELLDQIFPNFYNSFTVYYL